MKKGLKYDTITIAVIWASRILPAGAKGLWEKHLYLDLSDRGCFKSSPEMAALLGGEKGTVETYRQRLVTLGLLRKGLDQGVRLNWFNVFEEAWMPVAPEKGTKYADASIVAAARRLDAHLTKLGGWPRTRTPVRNPDGSTVAESAQAKPDPSPDLFAASEQASGPEVGHGGFGGSSIEERNNSAHLSVISEDRGSVQSERNSDRRSGNRGFEKAGEIANAWANRARETA